MLIIFMFCKKSKQSIIIIVRDTLKLGLSIYQAYSNKVLVLQ